MSATSEPVQVREASGDDLDAIRRIYNEGIEDRIATLETAPKTEAEIREWWAQHGARFVVLVALAKDAEIAGWASLNPFSHRCAHAAIADLSVYVSRNLRGHGMGAVLLSAIEPFALKHEFRKIVLHALNKNEAGKRLYRRLGYEEVGVFRQHGKLEGEFVDVVAMEKILPALRARPE
ncbi:MAG: arsinothricin resistance N-acetyltransferase ArsN1 family A [Candidatus Baltobacteraceae bacterium]